MVITSLENEKIKELIKLQRKKYRDLTNTYLVEGEHLVQEVLKEGLVIEIILLDGEEVFFDVPYTYVSYQVMKKLSVMDTPSKIIAVCKKNDFKEIVGEKILLLDEIQDPGNLGTIIRSAVAFNIDMIILSENTVDLYNPKVLRGTQGVFCHIPIIRMNSMDVVKMLKGKGYLIYGTNVENGVDARSLRKEDKNKFCLIMGNEGNGVRQLVQNECDKNLYIPVNKDVESLNVAIACSILLYELGE